MKRRQFLQSTVLGAAATMLGIPPPAAPATPLSFLHEDIMSDPMRPFAEHGELHRVIVDRERCVLPNQRGVPRPRAVTRKDAPSNVVAQEELRGSSYFLLAPNKRGQLNGQQV